MDIFASFFDKSPRIETERLILRRMKCSDAEDMFEYARLPEVTRFLLWAPHEDLTYTKRYLKQVEKSYKLGEFYDFGVILKDNNKFIGTCGFARIDKANATGEAGYVFNPEYWNRGIATEALSALIRLGFEYMGFNRIEARFMEGNRASRRVMEKCGMRYEGMFRDMLFVKEDYTDIGVCAVLKREYTPPKSLQTFKHC